MVEVGRAGCNFTRVAYAVVIAVRLATVGDEWTIIASVTARVAVGVQLIAICDVDAVVVAVGASVEVSVDGASWKPPAYRRTSG